MYPQRDCLVSSPRHFTAVNLFLAAWSGLKRGSSRGRVLDEKELGALDLGGA